MTANIAAFPSEKAPHSKQDAQKKPSLASRFSSDLLPLVIGAGVVVTGYFLAAHARPLVVRAWKGSDAENIRNAVHQSISHMELRKQVVSQVGHHVAAALVQKIGSLALEPAENLTKAGLEILNTYTFNPLLRILSKIDISFRKLCGLPIKLEKDDPFYDEYRRHGQTAVQINQKEKNGLFFREDLIKQMLAVLGRKDAGSVLLVGPPGSGKSSLVRCLVYRLNNETNLHPSLRNLTIKDLKSSEVYSSTARAIEKNEENQVVIFDEFGQACHSVVDEKFKGLLAGEKLRIIACVTSEEYKQIDDQATLRRFTVIHVDKLEKEDLKTLIEIRCKQYASHHQCQYSEILFNYAITATENKNPPYSTLAAVLTVLDTAGSITWPRSNNRTEIAEVTKEHVDQVLEHLGWEKQHTVPSYYV